MQPCYVCIDYMLISVPGQPLLQFHIKTCVCKGNAKMPNDFTVFFPWPECKSYLTFFFFFFFFHSGKEKEKKILSAFVSLTVDD